MTEPKERTYQAQTIKPPSLQPVRRAPIKVADGSKISPPIQPELEEIDQKQVVIIRLIDYIKSI
jgi:hypothetical protein